MQISLDKLLTMAEEPWQKSKYSYAISSIKTKQHEVNRCINDALELNGKLGQIGAACKDAENMYTSANAVDLAYQENYACINQAISEMQIPTRFIKQRSELWHYERKQSKVTGSTMFKALGLSTLKEQQKRFDRVTNESSKEQESSEITHEAMNYGVENEINAVGTLAAKILPVLAPYTLLHEEGYYKIPFANNPNFLIVSPDGSCRENDQVKYAIEIKCPVPNKKYTTDVHYAIPKYYITQILAEMAALKCEELLYVSWTPESTTVMKALFDAELWEKIKTELEEVYGGNGSRPLRKRPTVASLLKEIEIYSAEKVSLVCEMPSVVGIKCSHHSAEAGTASFILKHGERKSDEKFDKEAIMRSVQLSIKSLMTILSKEKVSLMEMFRVVRVPAKEVLVAVLSDLDRTYGPGNIHGVPVAYGLSGYRLKHQSMRSMMEDIINECYKKNIPVKSLSTDGQFYQLAVRDKEGKPLTILQLAKDTWEKVKKKPSKTDQVQQLMKLNYENHDSRESLIRALDSNLSIRDQDSMSGAIIVRKWSNQKWPKLYNPRNLDKLMKRNEKAKEETERRSTCDLDTLPSEAANMLFDGINDNVDRNIGNKDDMSIRDGGHCTTNQHANKIKLKGENSVDHGENEVIQINEEPICRVEEEMDGSEVRNSRVSEYHIDLTLVPRETLQKIVSDLLKFDTGRRKPKWKDLRDNELRTMLTLEPEETLKLFTKNELYASGNYFKMTLEKSVNKPYDKMTKIDLVNACSLVFGAGKQIVPKKSPLKLRMILKDFFLNKMPKDALNAVTATRVFLENDLPSWRQNAAFQDGITIGDFHEPYVWYSQPEFFPSVGEYIVYLLDCHHLLVNARSFVCQNGISGLQVDKQAWRAVVEASGSIETALNRAMVIDLIDRQSNAIAQIVFSEKVEEKMIELGWPREAKFCKTIREWYMAEDEAGLNPETRQRYRMTMRDLLLGSVNVADFPPPGLLVAGMTNVMFEGILTNIDRRCQLYALIPGNSYNVRAPNTLVVENLFSSFQELDPKSTGVLLPDDIPHAIETASYLIQTRLNPDRPFEMRTSRSTRVYPASSLHKNTSMTECVGKCDNIVPKLSTNSLTHISMAVHGFDQRQSSRSTKDSKIKNALIPDYDKPALGTQSVRQLHYKRDSSKVLPHVRHGLKYDI